MRKVIESKEFKVEGTFKSMYAAQEWITSKGYSYGSNSAMKPTAVMRGSYDNYDIPWKMKNFTDKQTKSVHGIMRGDMRNGTVIVDLYK